MGPARPPSPSPARGTQPDSFGEALRAKTLRPANRAGIRLGQTEYAKQGTRITDRSLTAYGEYLFMRDGSLYAFVPYREREHSGEASRTHFDNAGLGARFAVRDGMLLPSFGLEAHFTTGREALGIGSEKLGNLEAYFGLGIGAGRISANATLRYNSQVNIEFEQTRKRHFEKAWNAELFLAARFANFELVWELVRSYRFDPPEKKQSTTVLTAGFNYFIRPDAMIGVGLPLAVSETRDYDFGLVVRGVFFY